ncbi:FAD-dependent oxidoreductase [Sphingopyxis sp. MSC1_008]|uniref:FAD-dependent oxidoreductase n=1 Tax=Sphingopyxis sp. MSC1_008 TaxID=2909265 RepID=UPI0032C0439B
MADAEFGLRALAIFAQAGAVHDLLETARQEIEKFFADRFHDIVVGTRFQRGDRDPAFLSRKLAALLPGVDATPAYSWAGSFGDSPVGTPTIGRIPGMPNCFAAMGYGGNGITFSMMAAQMLRGLICGYGDPDADLVSFRRTF